jgi:hypothetical protein
MLCLLVCISGHVFVISLRYVAYYIPRLFSSTVLNDLYMNDLFMNDLYKNDLYMNELYFKFPITKCSQCTWGWSRWAWLCQAGSNSIYYGSVVQSVFRRTHGFRQNLQGFAIENLENFMITWFIKCSWHIYYDSHTIILIKTPYQVNDMRIELMFI